MCRPDSLAAAGPIDASQPATTGTSRRRMLGGALALAGAAVLGLELAKPAHATSLWVVAAGASGGLSTGWHSDSWFSNGAIDIDCGGGVGVAIYARISGTSSYGYYWCTAINDSCEAAANPGQKAIKFSIGTTSNGGSVFGECGYMHVVPYSLTLWQTGQAHAQIATTGTGTNKVYFDPPYNQIPCYTDPHLHQTAGGTHMFDPAYSPASAGNTEYWYWWV